MFESADMFDKCVEQNILSAQNVAEIYGIETEKIDTFEIPIISTIKISLPRSVTQGDLGDWTTTADNNMRHFLIWR